MSSRSEGIVSFSSGTKPDEKSTAQTNSTAIRRRSTRTQILSSIKPQTQIIEEDERKKCHKMLLTFLGQPGIKMSLSLMKFLTQESKSTAVQVLRFNSETGNLRYYTQGLIPLPNHQDINIDSCALLSQVVKGKQSMLLSNKTYNDKQTFFSTVAQLSMLFTEIPNSILAIPVILISRKCIGIVCVSYVSKKCPEVPKHTDELQFSLEKFRQCIDILVPFVMKAQEAEDSSTVVDLQLSVLKSINHTAEDQYIVDETKMIEEIAMQLKTLVPCQSMVLFIVENEGNRLLPYYIPEMRPNIVKKSCPKDHTSDASVDFLDSQELVWVVRNGRVLRVNDWTDCKEFGIPVRKKKIHTQGGCVVTNFMCVPVREASGKFPLIVQMMDKNGGFSTQDEYKAAMYAKFAASLLTTSAISSLRAKMKKRGAIFDEVVRNIVPITNEQIHELQIRKCDIDNEFKTFTYGVKSMPAIETSAAILYIFNDLSLIERWNMHRKSVIRFILCVQQSYRDIPYHNWMHAFSVTHYAYLLVISLKLVEKEYLSELEVLALIVSCIVHDVDHRGTNNHFQLCTQSFLYTLYKQDDSIMERHHLTVALAILSREDCNIVEFLSEKQYTDFIRLLSWNILATDVGKYLRCRDQNFVTMQSFDKTNEDHRLTLLSLIMTMADLCESTKPWNDNLKTVKCIFTEFFNQGDEERKMGWKPANMMDRKHAFIPNVEIKYVQYVCRPVYLAVSKTFPTLQTCVDMLDHHIELWYLSTPIFEKKPAKMDPLELLDKSEMLEENLWKSYTPQYMADLRGRRFSNIGGKISRVSLKTFQIREIKPVASTMETIKEDEPTTGDNAKHGKKQRFKWCC